MAAKRTTATKRMKKKAKATDGRISPEQRRFAKSALRLSQKARAEVALLLREQRARRITGDELETGLEEVVENLQRMLNHILASL